MLPVDTLTRDSKGLRLRGQQVTWLETFRHARAELFAGVFGAGVRLSDVDGIRGIVRLVVRRLPAREFLRHGHRHPDVVHHLQCCLRLTWGDDDLLYRHAWRLRDTLGLTYAEHVETRYHLLGWGLIPAVALLSIVSALIISACAESGWWMGIPGFIFRPEYRDAVDGLWPVARDCRA